MLKPRLFKPARGPLRVAKLVSTIVLAFFTTSCLIVTKHQLIDARNSKPDLRLSGRWVGQDKLEDVYALFDGQSSLETNILSGKGPANNSELMFDVVIGRIGKYQYMSLRPRDEAGGKGYLLVRYTIEGYNLKVWLLDSPLVEAAITRGKLLSDKGNSTTTLIDTPKKIVAFITANQDSEDLFEYLGTFTKDNKR